MTLRSRLFVGIAGTVLVSLVVTVVAGALLTRRSLEATAVDALERQVELIAAQRREDPSRGVDDELGRFLATDEQRLAILTPAQADLLLPDAAAGRLGREKAASGSLDVRGTRFLFAARRSGGEAIVLLRPASSQQADWLPFVLGLGVAGLVGAALAAAVALLLSRAVARPVARVSDASRSLASRESPTPVPVAGPAEVATLAASFNHLAQELRRTQDAERSFLLSVSHELKTPLTAIRGYAEAIQDGAIDPQEAAACDVRSPEIDSDDRIGPESPAGFLEGLAYDRVEKGLAVLEMAGGLVENQAIARALLDQQKLTVTLGDRRHRDVRLPYHAGHYRQVWDGF